MKKDLVVRFDGEKTEVSAEGGRKAGGGPASSAGAGVAPALPLSPNDNPAYGSPLRVTTEVAAGNGGGGGSDDRGELDGSVYLEGEGDAFPNTRRTAALALALALTV